MKRGQLTDAHQQEEDEKDVEHGKQCQGQRRDDLFERPAAASVAENTNTCYILDTCFFKVVLSSDIFERRSAAQNFTSIAGRMRVIRWVSSWKVQFGSPDLTRPKSRMTRRARRMRTMPVGWLVTMSDMTDMATMKASSRLQGFSKKARNQCEKALIESSTVKSSVKKRFSLSRVSCSWVAEPSGLVRSSTY